MHGRLILSATQAAFSALLSWPLASQDIRPAMAGVPAVPAPGTAGVPTARHSSLDSLVAAGLARSLARREQAYVLDGARAAALQARGLYLPSASLNARYTRVGGNTVDLGSLLNPALGALNDLLQRPAFPTNVDLQLPLRQETTVRLTQPVFQPALIQASRIANAAADAQQASHDASLRQLDASLRMSYLAYARARRVVELFQSTLPLADEHLRVSERLLNAGTVTPDIVQRARAERSAAVQQLDEAKQQANGARYALNVALNMPIDATVPLFADSELVTGALPPFEETLLHALRAREELRAIEHSRKVAGARVRLAQGSFLPNISMALDYGIQGREYRFDRSRDFSALTVLVSWNVFNGGQDAARVQEASIASQRVEMQRRALERAIELEVMTSWQAARVGDQALGSAADRADAARRAFDLVRKRQALGTATQLEYLDAQAAYTAAAFNQIVTSYDALARRIELDRAAARTVLAIPPIDRSAR